MGRPYNSLKSNHEPTGLKTLIYKYPKNLNVKYENSIPKMTIEMNLITFMKLLFFKPIK